MAWRKRKRTTLQDNTSSYRLSVSYNLKRLVSIKRFLPSPPWRTKKTYCVRFPDDFQTNFETIFSFAGTGFSCFDGADIFFCAYWNRRAATRPSFYCRTTTFRNPGTRFLLIMQEVPLTVDFFCLRRKSPCLKFLLKNVKNEARIWQQLQGSDRSNFSYVSLCFNEDWVRNQCPKVTYSLQ